MIRHKIAVIVLLAAAGLTVFNVLLEVPGMVPSGIGKFDAQTVAMAPELPPSGAIGFWSDSPETNPAEQQAALQLYYLTQYALPPLVLTHSLEEKFVLYFMSNAQGQVPYKHLQQVRDFGTGFRLMRNRTK